MVKSRSRKSSANLNTSLTLETIQKILDTKLEGGCESIIKISNERTLAQLWAGYGSVNSLTCSLSNGDRIPLIIKRVNPPSDSSISHERKLKSYHVEASFYSEVAPMIDAAVTEASVKCAIPQPYLIESTKKEGTKLQNPTFQFLLSDLRTRFPDEYGSNDELRTMTALRWLAAFHAIFWEHEEVLSDQAQEKANENNSSPFLWEHGGYWHLDTRLEEWEDMDYSWAALKNCAFAIDERMKADGRKMKTLVHGDFKAANILFNIEGADCGVVDFQYCGTGYGMKDVVMFIVSSTSSRVLQTTGEKGLLDAYHKELIENLKRIGRVPADRIDAITFSIIESQFKLTLLDYVRFMAGWGFWGSNSRYAQDRARSILEDICQTSYKGTSSKTLSSEEWKSAICNYFPTET